MSIPINHATLGGNLTRDPQLRFFAGDRAACSFTVASSRRYKVGDEQREDTLFMDCEAFGKPAETIARHFAKGKPIIVLGRLRQDTWQDKETGKNRSKTVLVVEHFHFVPDGSKRHDTSPAASDSSAPAPAAPATPPPADLGDDMPPF